MVANWVESWRKSHFPTLPIEKNGGNNDFTDESLDGTMGLNLVGSCFFIIDTQLVFEAQLTSSKEDL